MLDQISNTDAPILVAFSGGKDSVAMVLHLLESGIPKERIHLHHHDVDGNSDELFDWACTRSYCRAFARAFDLKLFFSYRNGGITRAIYRKDEAKQDVYFQREVDGEYHIAPSDKTRINTRMKFPAVSASLVSRWCSAEVKIDVLRTAIAHNPDYLGEIYILTGERREESRNRAKYQEIELHATNAKKRRAIAWRPIIDWSEEGVWTIMQRHGVQPHPAYMLGWNRCSCQLCIFGSADIWASIYKISPGKVLRIADIEDEIGFTLYAKQDILSKTRSGYAFEMDPYWISQATGEFTADIIINPDQWEYPKGAFKKETAGSI